ncbi:hypothetical protein [Bradyrhizobium sp. Ai1a-2]|uniref:hypothetical protein n=1 Tax=Bradyrhizobium sp. Ai1a-2 TaxID=196490 RepID=UPI000486CC0C|nr:hypothetical protein [Bradyrhizobium sp. Ai1a-2]
MTRVILRAAAVNAIRGATNTLNACTRFLVRHPAVAESIPVVVSAVAFAGTIALAITVFR